MRIQKRYGLVLSLCFIVALTFSVALAAAATIDFDGITCPSSTHTAKYDIDHETLENDPTIGTEFTTAMYEAISFSDETYAVTRVMYDYFHSQQIFRFQVDDVPIQEFTVTWEGNIAFLHVVGGLNIWNGTSWESMSTISAVGDGPSYPEPPTGASVQGRMEFMAPDETITKTYTENISDYIDNGYITLLVWAKNCHDTTICTDYVKLECTPPKHYLKVISPYGTSGGEGWYDQGTDAYAALDNGIVDHGNGTRRVFAHWSGDASGTSYTESEPIHMDQNKTAIANWKTQYLATFNHAGLDTTATGTVVTVNGSVKTLSDLPFSMWVDSETSISYSYTNMVSSTDKSKRFMLVNVAGPASPITLTNPVTVTGNYKTQYQVTFDQSGVGPDFTGTAVTIDGADDYGAGTLPVSFWWDDDSTHSFDFKSPLIVTANTKQYVWTSTSGLSSLQSGSIAVSTSGNITGNYNAQYYLTVTSPYGTTGGEGWHDSGDTAYATVAPLSVSGPTGVRYVFTHWSGDASGTTSPSNPITMNAAKHATANWKTQHYLTVKTDPTGLTPAPTPQSDWYDKSVDIVLTAPTESYLDSVKYIFDYWDVDGASQGSRVNEITVHMGESHTATAHYKIPPPPLSVSINPLSASIFLGDSVAFTSTVSGGAPPYTYQWYLNDNPVSSATSNSWTFTPAESGIYYVYLKVTDAYNNVAQSETARITVTVIPVGGYSVSLTKPVAKAPLTCYTILLAIFGAAMSLIRRKRKQI